MSYAVVLCFDPESEARIEEMWSELAANGISDHMLASDWRPHISLAVFDALDVHDAEKKLNSLAAGMSSFTLTLPSLGVFPNEESVLFLGPVVTEDLLRVHRELHKLLETYRDAEWSYYLVDRWVPHCTLAERLPHDVTGQAVNVCLSILLPVEVRVTEITLVEFRPVIELSKSMLEDTDE